MGGVGPGRLDPAVAEVRRAVRAGLAALAPGTRVLVACSGGADSLALAAAAAFEGPRAGLIIGGVTVDHQRQEGSAELASRTATAMRRLGLDPVEVVPAGETAGGSEAAARTARYAALASVADRLGAAVVLLGHTRDDQAETVLLGLARGSGARSLAGMADVRGRWRRPLLSVPRSVTHDACAGSDLPFWEDPENADPAYARSRVRHTVLPVLEAELGPGIAAALARTAQLLRADSDALDGWAERAHQDAGKDEALVIERLQALPTAVRRRVLRRAATVAGCPPTDLTAGHLAAVDALVVDWHGQHGVDLPGRVRAWRRGRLLGFARDDAVGG